MDTCDFHSRYKDTGSECTQFSDFKANTYKFNDSQHIIHTLQEGQWGIQSKLTGAEDRLVTYSCPPQYCQCFKFVESISMYGTCTYVFDSVLPDLQCHCTRKGNKLYIQVMHTVPCCFQTLYVAVRNGQKMNIIPVRLFQIPFCTSHKRNSVLEHFRMLTLAFYQLHYWLYMALLSKHCCRRAKINRIKSIL